MPKDLTASAHRHDSGPSRLWYLLAVAIFVAGMTGMGVFLSNRLASLGENLVQVVVPGQTEVALNEGSYTIFHERQSTVDGRFFSFDGIAGLGVTLTSAEGEAIALTPPSTNSGYEFGGRSGTAVFEMEIVDPGVYLLSAAYRDAVGPETVLAIGKEFGGDLFYVLFGAFALAITGVGLALAVAWKLFLKRREATGHQCRQS